MLLDLRTLENAVKATKDCVEVYNLAADMGGMGFIQSNGSVLFYNNTMISFNVCEAARFNGVKRFFYSSSACVYNESAQLETANPGLKESDAWPAQPQDSYGLEKLVSEELVLHYGKDFDMETRVARFHNIYGPHGTWKGGREKVPAAFCRKALTSEKEFEIWGDGKQTRSFMYIDDLVEGVIRLMESDCRVPINMGSDFMIDMNDLADLCIDIAGKKGKLTHKHVKGPEGVRGRNSDNDLIKEKLKWEPSISLKDGMSKTMAWIKTQIEADKKKGINPESFTKSEVVVQTTESLEKVG